MPSASLKPPGVTRRRQLRVGAAILDQCSALSRIVLLEEASDRDLDLLGVAEEPFAVGGRELERLGVAMQELERPRPKLRDVVALEDVQRHRHERPLRPRTARIHVNPAVGRVDWRLDTRALPAEILLGDRAAGLAHERRDLFGDVPLVHRVARRHDRVRPPDALVGALDRDEPAEERAELALDEDLAHARPTSVWQEHRRARRPLPQAFLEALDRHLQAGVHREAVAELDRGREHLRERETAVPRERGQPRVGSRRCDRAGHTDRHIVAVPRAIGLEVERGGPVPETVDRLGPGHSGPEHDDRSDAAKIGEVALENI